MIKVVTPHLQELTHFTIDWNPRGRLDTCIYIEGEVHERNTQHALSLACSHMTQMFMEDYIKSIDKDTFKFTYNFEGYNMTLSVSLGGWGDREVDCKTSRSRYSGYLDSSGLTDKLLTLIGKVLY